MVVSGPDLRSPASCLTAWAGPWSSDAADALASPPWRVPPGRSSPRRWGPSRRCAARPLPARERDLLGPLWCPWSAPGRPSGARGRAVVSFLFPSVLLGVSAAVVCPVSGSLGGGRDGKGRGGLPLFLSLGRGTGACRLVAIVLPRCAVGGTDFVAGPTPRVPPPPTCVWVWGVAHGRGCDRVGPGPARRGRLSRFSGVLLPSGARWTSLGGGRGCAPRGCGRERSSGPRAYPYRRPPPPLPRPVVDLVARGAPLWARRAETMGGG